ncbi:MAG: methyltransferase domain-containing protein [Acidobacteria bacterium]|nr:methyltransferase domain-containing protein [Acidobacteriota bacterium]MCA1611853.1 methyltransferase domain-containing protein [Acidobacteriota bacterium]
MTERFTPGPVDVYTSYEHWHRYLWVLSRAKDRSVLDLACGSGYGSWLLAGVARRVHGVDRDEASIAQARTRFVRDNLTYEAGDAETYQGDPVDLVVSFETIEHLDNPERLLDVIRRNLVPDGIALISTPNRKTYSEETGYSNPFHTREFDIEEFLAMLRERFPTVVPYGQRLVTGSLISSIEGERFRRSTVAVEPVTFDGSGGLASTGGSGPSPTYQLVEVSLAPGKALPRSGSVLLDRDSLLWTQMAQGGGAVASLAAELQKQIENILLVQGQVIALEAAMHSVTSAGSLAPELQKQIDIAMGLQRRMATVEGFLEAMRDHQMGAIHEELQRRIETAGEQRDELAELRSLSRSLAAGSAAIAEELQKQIGERLRLETEIAEARRIAAESEQRSSSLESRLQVLENARPPRPSVDLSTGPSRDRAEELVHALQGMIEDVAADNRDLHKQIDLLVSNLQNGSGPPRVPGKGIADAARNAIPPRLRSVLGRGRRALARRLRAAAGGDASRRSGAARIELVAGERPSLEPPLLSIVVLPQAAAFLEIARRQTLASREWLRWDPDRGDLRIERDDGTVVSETTASDAAGLRAAASGAYLVLLDAEIARAPLAWWETAVFAMAGEGLAFLRTPAVERGAAGEPSPPFLMARREIWSLEGIDAEPLTDALARGRALVAGKEAVGTFAGALLAPALDLPALPESLRRLDLYWIPAAAPAAGAIRLEIAAVDRLLSRVRFPDPRPSVLLLLPDPPGSRAEEEIRSLLGDASGMRLLIVSCAPGTPALAIALDRFREVTPHVYSLGDVLPRELFFSAVSHLLRCYEVAAVVQVGESSWFHQAARHIREEFPSLRLVVAPPAGSAADARPMIEIADLILAQSSRQHQELARIGNAAAKIRRLPRGLPSRPSNPRPKPRDQPAETVVAWIGDLVPGERPEDFLAIARRFRGDDGFRFHLAGDGPLAADVDTLIESMGLTNVRRSGRDETASSVLAEADVLCTTAERLAWPGIALEALARGIPVVSPALSDLAEDIPADAAGIPAVAAGQAAGFETALRSLGTPERRRAAAAAFDGFLGGLPPPAEAARALAAQLLGQGTTRDTGERK